MSGTVRSTMSIDEIEALVKAFETGSMPPGDFSHRRHLTVALSYLTSMEYEAAVDIMRAGLKRFLAHHGIDGYHETITVFWLRRLFGFVAKRGPNESRLELIGRCLEQNAEGKVIFKYYRRERLISETAKLEWVEPDLRPMD
ncbi:MAG: hypothetical protein ABIP75_17040 [Pyrinomonadaceae bacterium]